MTGGGLWFDKYHHHHIRLMNRFRKVEIKAGSKRVAEEWLEQIRKVESESPWIQNHRFGSFAPIRNNARVKWFVDGEGKLCEMAEHDCIPIILIFSYLRLFRCCCRGHYGSQKGDLHRRLVAIARAGKFESLALSHLISI